MDNPRIYISPERRQKPHGKFWSYDVWEHDYCVELAHLIADKAIQQGFQPIVATQKLTINQRPAEAGDADFYLPLHTNASTDGGREGTASGCEIFYKDDACKAAANIMYDFMTALYPSKRGIKWSETLYENRAMDYGCYLEIAFHDNGKDAEFLLNNKEAIATNIVKALCKIFKRDYIEADYKALYESTLKELADLRRQYTELEASAQAFRQRVLNSVEQFDNGAKIFLDEKPVS